jgi:hypothetical protein
MGTSASFNNSSGYNNFPAAASSGISGPLPEIPPPQQIAPHAMASPTPTQMPTSTPLQQPAYTPLWPAYSGNPPLHTHITAMADPMAPIPPPEQLAPHVFFKNPPGASSQAAGAQAPQGMPPSQTKEAQQTQNPQQPPTNQTPLGQQQPPGGQQQNQNSNQQQNQSQQSAKTKEAVDQYDGALTDDIVKKLNREMNDPDEMTRATAASDLSSILQKHPKLADSPEYKPYIDAFMEKELSDPSTLVRGMGEMTLQLGVVPHPSEAAKKLLNGLAQKDDSNLTKENTQASSILAGIENGSLGKDLDLTAPHDKDKNKKEKSVTSTDTTTDTTTTNNQSAIPKTPVNTQADPTNQSPASPDGQSPPNPNNGNGSPAPVADNPAASQPASSSSQTDAMASPPQAQPSVPPAANVDPTNLSNAPNPRASTKASGQSGFTTHLHNLKQGVDGFLPSWMRPNNNNPNQQSDSKTGQRQRLNYLEGAGS